MRLKWVRATWPIAKYLLRQSKHTCWVYVTSYNQRRVVGHVVTRLNRAHLLRRDRAQYPPISERILPARVPGVEQRRHALIERKEWARFGAVVLPQHHFLLAHQILVAKEWRPE